MASSDLYTVKLKLPAGLDDKRAGSFASRLEDIAISTSMLRENNDHRADWVITWIFSGKPAPENIKAALEGESDWAIERVPDINWLEHSYRQFQPFEVAGFFVYGSHYKDGVPEGLSGLQIDAATAFGSGEHGTTAGCIDALAFLENDGFEFRNILDMGTGSGILAIAAHKLWPEAANLAVDIEEESVIVTKRHAQMNDAAAIIAIYGDGFATPEVQAQKPFDLVIANILAGPLVDMAGDMTGVAKPGGFILLSGMLEEQATNVLAAYEGKACRLYRRFDLKGWSSLLLQKL